MKFLKVLEFEFRADWATSMPPSTKPLPPPIALYLVSILELMLNFRRRKKGDCWGRFTLIEKRYRESFGGVGCTLFLVGLYQKNDYSFWRIIHKYSYPSTNHGSVNSALMNTSVKYMSFEARVEVLARV